MSATSSTLLTSRTHLLIACSHQPVYVKFPGSLFVFFDHFYRLTKDKHAINQCVYHICTCIIRIICHNICSSIPCLKQHGISCINPHICALFKLCSTPHCVTYFIPSHWVVMTIMLLKYGFNILKEKVLN